MSSIPAKIVIIKSRQNKTFEGKEFIPAFVCPADRPKSIETGKRWAEGYYTWPKTDKTRDTVEIVEMENKPFTGIRIFNLEVRNEGGRAYKVATEDGYWFDLREDVLLDVIRNTGIKKGGVLNGEFIWATVGSQNKIIRVGSSLHKECLEDQKTRNSPIKQSEYEVGRSYSNNNGNFIYLGRVAGLGYWLKHWGNPKLPDSSDDYIFMESVKNKIVYKAGDKVEFAGNILEYVATLRKGKAVEDKRKIINTAYHYHSNQAYLKMYEAIIEECDRLLENIKNEN